MLKKDLLALVATQRARISQLETQLLAVRAEPPLDRTWRGAIARLHALYPSAKSFTAAEVAAEIGCRSCSA